MTATYQTLLRKAYVQRLSRCKSTEGLLNLLDVIVEDYQKEITPNEEPITV